MADNIDKEDPAIEDEDNSIIEQIIIADAGQEPLRVDRFLLDRIPNTSRNKIQNSTKAGCVLVNGQIVKSNYKVKAHDEIKVYFPKSTPDVN